VDGAITVELIKVFRSVPGFSSRASGIMETNDMVITGCGSQGLEGSSQIALCE
jgi:hypothetical protein